MDRYFKGTGFYWAYNILSDDCGAAKADMWRYAVLWAFGGLLEEKKREKKVVNYKNIIIEL